MISYLHADTVRRSTGMSVVASSAYISGSKETNEYTGLTHNYKSKDGIVCTDVCLPPNAPEEYKSPEKLWSSIEMAEKSPKAKLAISIIAAIPIELPQDSWEDLARDYSQKFVDLGCCVQYAVHDPITTDDQGTPLNEEGIPASCKEEYRHGNPHIHLLITERMLDEQGKWLPRTEGLYFVKNDAGEETKLSASELKRAGDLWQKEYQYQYDDGIKAWMTKAEGEQAGLVRVSRMPRKDKHGVETPEVKYINDPKFMHDVRMMWGDSANKFLDMYRPDITERVDMRSYKDQKNGKMSQIHMGPAGKQIERRMKRLSLEGKDSSEIITSRIDEVNAEIRRYNHTVDFYAKEEAEAKSIEDESERDAKLLETYRREWISAKCHDQTLTQIVIELEQERVKLSEKLQVYDSEMDKIQRNMQRIRTEIDTLKEKLNESTKRGEQARIQKEIQEKEALLQTGIQLIEKLRKDYGYDDDRVLKEDRDALKRSEARLDTKNQLLHTAKAASADAKKKYLDYKRKVPETRKVIVQRYRQQIRNTAPTDITLTGLAVGLVVAMIEDVQEEEEREEYFERMY